MTPTRDRTALIAIAALALCYWAAVGLSAPTAEPWDAAGYWTLAYPLSLALGAVAGAVVGRRAWRAGAVVTMAQLPVMVALGSAGSMTAFAVLILITLSVPAAALSALAGRLTRR